MLYLSVPPGRAFAASSTVVSRSKSPGTGLQADLCLPEDLVINNAKAFYRQAFRQADHSVGRYQQMLQLQQQDYVLARYLSAP